MLAASKTESISSGLRCAALRAGFLMPLFLLLTSTSASAEEKRNSDTTPTTPRAVDAQALLDRAFENLYGFNSIQKVHISASTRGSTFERDAQVIRQAAHRQLNRMLIRFNYPHEMRGLGILLLERPSFEYDVFLYQPTVRKVRRVSIYQRVDPFFGTDVAFEDLEGKRAAQWIPRFIRIDRIEGRHAAVLELTPKGFPSGYTKLLAWFDQEFPVISKIEFYKDKELLKTAVIPFSHIDSKDGFHVPTRLEFFTSSGTRTVLEFSRIELLDEIPPDRFTTTALEFGDERRDARGLR